MATMATQQAATTVLTLSEIEAIFLLCLRELLPSLRRYSDKQLVTKIGKEKLEESTDQLTDYLENSCGGQTLTKNEFHAMAAQLLRCLSDYLTSIQVPVTVNTMTSNIHLLNHSVEQMFPGYAASGLLGRIISPRNLSGNPRASIQRVS